MIKITNRFKFLILIIWIWKILCFSQISLRWWSLRFVLISIRKYTIFGLWISKVAFSCSITKIFTNLTPSLVKLWCIVFVLCITSILRCIYRNIRNFFLFMKKRMSKTLFRVSFGVISLFTYRYNRFMWSYYLSCILSHANSSSRPSILYLPVILVTRE